MFEHYTLSERIFSHSQFSYFTVGLILTDFYSRLGEMQALTSSPGANGQNKCGHDVCCL